MTLFRDRLNLWKKLFDHGSSGLLEPYQVKGLIAELLVLEAILLAGRRSPLEAAIAWVGPAGADQDFQFSDEAIEVKAVSPGAESISISSLQQLDAPVPIRVSMYTMRPASPGEPDAIGLNTLVLRLRDTFPLRRMLSRYFGVAFWKAGMSRTLTTIRSCFSPCPTRSFRWPMPFRG